MDRRVTRVHRLRGRYRSSAVPPDGESPAVVLKIGAGTAEADRTGRWEHMAGKTMIIRRDGQCAACGALTLAGTRAVWFADERVLRCVSCVATISGTVETPSPASDPDVDAKAVRAPSSERDSSQSGVQDTAGGSAQHEYTRRSAKEASRNQKLVADDATWRAELRESRPIIGRIITAFTPAPQIGRESQSTTAWKVGAEGERRVADVLTGVDGIDVLHDRLVPGSRANIDHIVVGQAGVFVVDAKKYTGAVQTRDVGGWLRTDVRLYVDNRDRTSLVDGVERQVEIVRSALADQHADVDVRGVLCFVGAEWGVIMRPRHVRGVTALWPVRLVDHVTVPGAHAERISDIASVLRRALRPAVKVADER
jgi:hypothetical protein